MSMLKIMLTTLVLCHLCLSLPVLQKNQQRRRGNYHLQSTEEPPSDQQIIQNILQGIFAQNKLEGPFMVKYCFTPELAHQTVAYIDEVLPQAANASAKDLIELVLQTKIFVDSLPFSFLECLGKQEEIRTLGEKFDIDAGTDFTSLEKKIGQYVALHYLIVHRWMQEENTRWQDKQYFDTGYYGSIIGHKIQYWRPNKQQ